MVCAVEVYSFRSSAARPLTKNSGFENNPEKISVYPNPVRKRLTIHFPDKFIGNSNLLIVDAAGRTYDIGKIQVQPGELTKEIDISNYSLKPGFYYLRVISDVRPVEVIKLIVI